MYLSECGIYPEIGPLLEKRLEKLIKRLGPDVDEYCADPQIDSVSGESHEGYFSLCDGAVIASVFVKNDCEVSSAFSEAGADGSATRMIDARIACGASIELARIIEDMKDDGEDVPDFDWMTVPECLKDTGRAWDAISAAKDAAGDPDLSYDETGNFRLSIGCVLRERDMEPFYVYVSANFDDPYYRDDAQIRLDCGRDSMKCDFLLGEASGPVPRTRKELEALLDKAVCGAFPDLPDKSAPKRGPKC